MRLPRVRFTVRWMLAAVAVAGILFAGEAVRRRRVALLNEAARWARLRARAREDLDNERELLEVATMGLNRTETMEKLSRQAGRSAEADGYAAERNQASESAALQRKEVEGRRARLAFLVGMESKYRRAARYPWRPVEPDPPEPK